MPVPGTLFILSAPSGGGKTSLVRALLERDPAILKSVSHTTRAPRPSESEGVHYHFVKSQHFDELIQKGNFLEHAEVFGNYYGTSKVWVESQLKKGFDVILDIDWQGARHIRKLMSCISIFILPPSREILRERLQYRAQDSSEVIEGRMKQASREVSHYHEYDYVIVNDVFETAVHDLEVIIQARRKATVLQNERLAPLIQDLLS